MLSVEDVAAAVASVDDPEYPEVSIADLGLIETIDVGHGGHVRVGLIPTFNGCPALRVITDDVHHAVARVEGVTTVQVDWLHSPTWTTDRITPHGQAALADRFTVAVQLGTEPTTCPRCATQLTESSMFGPSRCRSVSHCANCAETVEVMRA